MAKKTPKSERIERVEKSPVLSKVTHVLLDYLEKIVRDCNATAVFVYQDALGDKKLNLDKTASKVFYIIRSEQELPEQQELRKNCFRVPNVPLTRIGQVKVAILIALSRGLVKKGDTVAFLTGIAGTKTLDTINIFEIGAEYEFFLAPEDDEIPNTIVNVEVLSRIIDIASELGCEGREGKPIGALFVVGDHERTLSLTRQMILNPFMGYPEDKRNILNHELEETVKEFASLDGAFIIRSNGVIETAGAHIKTASQEEYQLPQGLGARHHAAAAITGVSQAIAIALSESTGTVTLFKNGKIITEIEKLRSLAP